MRWLSDMWWRLSGQEARHVEEQARRVAAGWTPRWFGTLLLSCPPPPPIKVIDRATPALEDISAKLVRAFPPRVSSDEAATNLSHALGLGGVRLKAAATEMVTWEDGLEAIHDQRINSVHIRKRRDDDHGGGNVSQQ